MSGQGQGGSNLCFYSNKCQWSKAFITELSKTPWKNQFRFICVDPGPARPQLPGWIKKVPTIVIAGESEPRTDSEVMNWLYEKKMKEGGGGSSGGGHTMQPSGGEGGGGDPAAFSVFENVSFAKGFSYSGIDTDTNSQGDGGFSMPGAFSFLNGGASGGDRLGQDLDRGGASGGGGGGGAPKRSKKEELFNLQMEQYKRERESGMPKGPNRM